MARVDKFDGEYRFLSNFWMVPIPLENIWYESTEHAYQAAKTLDITMKLQIKNAKTPGEAKKLGKKVSLRPDWEQVKIDYMRYLVWYKFAMYPDLGAKLLATGDAELIEGNTWNDRFWGRCNGMGENWLGRILMEVRDQIRRNGMAETPPERPEPKVFKPIDAKFEPRPGYVFVFGSNLAGVHGAGAAHFAVQHCGAVMGQGIGLMPADNPASYALPTKDENIQTLPLEEVRKHVDKFIETAWERRDLSFFVTRIGCGLAGFNDYQIAPLFKDAPPNCDLPPGWENFEEIYGANS